MRFGIPVVEHAFNITLWGEPPNRNAEPFYLYTGAHTTSGVEEPINDSNGG